MRDALKSLFNKGLKVIPRNGEYLIASIENDSILKRCKNPTEVQVAAAIM